MHPFADPRGAGVALVADAAGVLDVREGALQQMRRKGVMAEPPSERALRLTWRACGALPKMLCVMVWASY